MARYGSGSVPIATGWKCTNCRRTHRSSIPRSASGNTRARPALTTDTSRPPRNWSAPCPGSSERCNTILSQSDPICFLFADRYVPLIMRACIGILACAFPATTRPTTLSASTRKQDSRTAPATRATGLAPSATVFRRPRRKSVAVVRVLAGRCLGPVLVGRFPRTEVGRKRYPDNLCEPPLMWSNFF